MCGIAGIFNSRNELRETTINMLSMIDHRGPDEMGFYHDTFGAFGTVRLSIIDLAGGTQPMADDSNRYWIAYNGEVYNYVELRDALVKQGFKFRTHSDTEVVLNSFIHWGHESFGKLNGAFSFIIYDRQTKEVVLVRDRFGQRPLFYTVLPNNQLVFASEIKSFLEVPEISLSLDPTSLESIFYTWGSVPGQTAFNNIFELPQGTYMKYTVDGIKSEYYYKLEIQKNTFQGTFDEAVEATKEKIKQAVDLRLLRSDVEVGTYLSGGLDSSIVTEIAKRTKGDGLRTYSIAFEDKNYDETQFQTTLSENLSTIHRSIVLSDKDIVDYFPHAMWHAEVPVFRTALVPMYLLSKLVHEDGIKVVLTGEGADESFLGYNIFKETKLRNEWSDLSLKTRETRLLSLYPYLQHFQDRNAKALVDHFDRFSADSSHIFFSHLSRLSNSRLSVRLLKETIEYDHWIEREASRLDEMGLNQKDPVGRAQWMEYNTLLSGYLLSSQGDRAALANSVENRAPFLDYNVVEWANALPMDYRLKDGINEKYILKEAFKDVLPESIINRPKQPYRSPETYTFLKHPDCHPVELIRSENEIKKAGVFDARITERFVKKIFSGDSSTISPNQNQAFMFLLSTTMLFDLFISGNNSWIRNKSNSSSVNEINGNELPAS